MLNTNDKRRFFADALKLAFLALVVGCGGSSGPGGGGGGGIIPAELVGSWTTSCALASDPTGTFDPLNLVARGQLFTLAIGSDGTYSRSDILPDQSRQNTSGDLSLPASGVMEFSPAGGSPFRWNYTTSQFTLVLTFADTVDFDGNSIAENADYRVEMNGVGREPVCPSIGSMLPGSWEAQTIDVTGAGQQLELVAGGGAMALTVSAGGTFNLSFTAPGATVPDTAAGLFAVFNNTLVFDDVDGENFDRDFTVSATTLRLMYEDPYDVDGDGAVEQALFDVSMTRQ